MREMSDIMNNISGHLKQMSEIMNRGKASKEEIQNLHQQMLDMQKRFDMMKL